MNYKHLLFGILLASTAWTRVSGQEMLGTTLGNYSGVNGIQLNPSSMHNSRAYLDINFLSADFFADNNYLYLSKEDYRFSRFFQSNIELPVHQGLYGTGEQQFYQNDRDGNKNAYQQFRINGPGVMLIWGRHAFGITTGMRSVVSLRRVPYDIANFVYMGLTYTPQQGITYDDKKSFRGAEMSWAEVGLSYSYAVYQRGFDRVTVGLSARRLFGYAGLYFKVNNANYIVPNDTTLHVNNLNAEVGYSIPINYQRNEFWNSTLFPGKGWGFDIGATYTRFARIHSSEYFNHLCEQPYEDYIYRLGVALIDVGAIHFKDHAVKMSIDDQDADWDGVNHAKFTTIQQFADTISYQFYGDRTSAFRGDNFYLWLPAALSIQFDYHYYKNWYLNGSFIWGFNLAPGSLTRPAQIALTPRYETGWFEAELPVSLYDWSLPRIGLALRFYQLTIGTEKLGQFFKFRDFSGMDFYFSIHYFLGRGICKTQKVKGCLDNYERHIR
jgi:hypothetical protein